MNDATLATPDIVRRIRASLPDEAFQPAPHRLWLALANACVIAGGYAIIRRWPHAAPLAALPIGHALASLAFVGHEASHNAVLRHPRSKRLFCLLAFGLNGISPTMWNRLHNDAHHRHANTRHDPDRPFLVEERTAATDRFTATLFPHADSVPWNFLVLFHFVSYIERQTVTVFAPHSRTAALVPARPAYRRHERFAIAGELAVVAALQAGVWWAVGGSWWNYAWASPAALVTASAILMVYVFTNHFLNPITSTHDPIDATTSVAVPNVFDRLHSNFSFHTEHHLFPSLNADYYPEVSAALSHLVPHRYHRLALGDAWRQLWRARRYRTIDESPLPPHVDAPVSFADNPRR